MHGGGHVGAGYDPDKWADEYDDAIEEVDPDTHECTVCDYSTKIDTPYNSLPYWCRGDCGQVRRFVRLTE